MSGISGGIRGDLQIHFQCATIIGLFLATALATWLAEVYYRTK